MSLLHWSTLDNPIIAPPEKTAAEISSFESQFSSSTTSPTTGGGESERNIKEEIAGGEEESTNNVLYVPNGDAPVVVATDSSVFTISTLLSPSSQPQTQPPAPLQTNVEAPSTMATIKSEMQPLHTVSNSTVSAAADSSDNQPPTPTPDHQSLPPPSSSTSSSSSAATSSLQHHQQQQQQQQQHQHQLHHLQQQQLQQQSHLHHPLYGSSGVNSNQMYQDMHSYHPPGGGYLGGYEQFYHAPPAGVDYGSAMQQLQQQNQALSYQMQNQSLAGSGGIGGHSDYKVMAPSQRFHPYLNNGGLHHLSPAAASASQNSHSVSSVAVSANGGSSVNNTSSSVSNSSLSPRVVSSSSPSQNNSSANHGMGDVKGMSNRTPTPSASKQCNKCGILCATESDLNEHYSTIHGAPTSDDCINSAATDRSASAASERGQYLPFAPYIKEEPPSSDILDLDSQKMVYPPQSDDETSAAASAVNSGGLIPMQRPMAWPQDLHPAYMAGGGGPPHLTTSDNKHAGGFYPKQEFTTIKSEFHPIKSDYVSPTSFGMTSLKSSIGGGVEYGQPIAPQTRPDEKPFGSTDLATGNNPVSSSPSEFPSTTTPQDNIGQYRNFEPPTSSLPSGPGSAKSATWKSNEARRPKTYNCTACNKWFTSSGHLKRHYNTTLHKNAVKSSGQPDPATMPISAHHHPSRDPNSKHHRNSQARQPPPIPPEPPRSPDFSSQYTSQSPNGFSSQSQAQQQQSQTFQQYQQHPQQNNLNGHPNGLAGPSVQASQPRGLLTISSTEVSIMDREEEQLHNSNNNITNSSLQLQEEQYHQQELEQPSPSNSPNSSSNNNLEEDYHQSTAVISLHQPQLQQQQQRLLPPLQSPHIISHPQYRELHHIPHMAHHHQTAAEPTTIFNHTTATTIHNIMDPQQQQLPQQQQQYIINPLAINTTTPITLNNTTTTIPSYQHLQQQVADHQQSYPTIIGNDTHDLIQLNNFVDIASLTNSASFQQQQQQMVALDANGHIVQFIHQPAMMEMQRFSGGLPSFKENLMQPPSPAAPESFYSRMSPFGSQSSPQEADIPPMHTTASAPQQTTDQTNPYSPTVSSSTTTTTANQLSSTNNSDDPPKQLPVRKLAVKRKRESNSSSSSQLTTTTNATSTTLPTGRLKCEECNKEFTKICYLTQHNKSFHSGEQPYRCQKCGKRFQSEEIYESHLDRHKSQDKPHKCDLCPKQFHHKTDLRRHIEAIHTGFKAHTCNLCNKSFCRKDHLRKHSDIHLRPKPVKKAKTTTAAGGGGTRKKATKSSAATAAAVSVDDESSPLTTNTTTTTSNSPMNQALLSVEDNSDSSSAANVILQPKYEIVKLETYSMAGQELVYI